MKPKPRLYAPVAAAHSEPETRTSKPPPFTAAGFTLIETLIVLALIGLIAGVLIGGSTSLISKKTLSTDELFWKVVQESRKLALETGREVHLRFEPKDKSFVIEDGAAPRTFPVSATAGSDISVDFLSTQKGASSSILIGGVVIETQPLPTGVTFYDDGTCTPFRAQIRANGGAHILEIDPWTGAAVLSAKDPLSP